MRVAVEVLVPLRLFVCRFLSQHRINLLLALGAVAHLNLNFSKKFRLEVHIMAYNKAREEKKWRLWKEAEEKQLRKQRMQEAGTYLEGVADDTQQPEIKTVEDFLNSIENQQLYQVLIKVDRLTLHIAFMKVQGYSTREIASYLRITEKAVYRRLDRLKEKIQKIFE